MFHNMIQHLDGLLISLSGNAPADVRGYSAGDQLKARILGLSVLVPPAVFVVGSVLSAGAEHRPFTLSYTAYVITLAVVIAVIAGSSMSHSSALRAVDAKLDAREQEIRSDAIRGTQWAADALSALERDRQALQTTRQRLQQQLDRERARYGAEVTGLNPSHAPTEGRIARSLKEQLLLPLQGQVADCEAREREISARIAELMTVTKEALDALPHSVACQS